MKYFETESRAFWNALTKHQGTLATCGAPHVVRDELIQAEAWRQGQEAHICAQLTDLTREYSGGYIDWNGEPPIADPIPSRSPWDLIHLGAATQILLAAACGFWLVTQMYTMAPIGALASGSALAVLAYTLVSVSIHMLRDESRKPRAYLIWLRKASLAAFVAWFITLIAVLVAAVSLPQHGWNRSAEFAALMAAGLLLSGATSALLAAMGDHLAWANPLAQRWRELQRQSEVLAQLKQQCQTVRDRLAKPDPAGRPRAA